MTPTDFSISYVAPKEPKPRHVPTAGTFSSFELATCAGFACP